MTSEKDGMTPADYGNIIPTFSSSSLYASENSDDVLIFADPYDTSDHWQDRKVAPKPYQLQPFIVIDTVEKIKN